MVRDDVPAGQAVTPFTGTPMANGRRTCGACRPSSLGMSYPQALTLHAAHPGSLRYGRTPLRPRKGLDDPTEGTFRTRRGTLRNPGWFPGVAPGMVPSTATPRVPLPRRPLMGSRIQRWYEEELGWAVVPGAQVRLRTGLRFDVLELPAAAGHAVCGRLGARGTGPVALQGDTPRFLVAPGSAGGLPGLPSTGWSGVRWPSICGPWARAERSTRRCRPDFRARGEPPYGCGPPSRDARWSRHCRPSPPSGAARTRAPISYASWTRRRLSATGPGC